MPLVAGDTVAVSIRVMVRGCTTWRFRQCIVGRVRSGTVAYLTKTAEKFTLRKSGHWVKTGRRDNGKGPLFAAPG
jgi:hypothetical protein